MVSSLDSLTKKLVGVVKSLKFLKLYGIEGFFRVGFAKSFQLFDPLLYHVLLRYHDIIIILFIQGHSTTKVDYIGALWLKVKEIMIYIKTKK